MKRIITLTVALLAISVLSLQAQTTVSGVIQDANSNEGLIGANVLIKGTSVGTTTDIDGQFTLTSNEQLPWTLEISYTGYNSQEVEINSGQSGLNITLTEGVLIGQEVVVSASRRREKVQEAPASISIYNARKLQASPNDNLTLEMRQNQISHHHHVSVY